MFFHRYRRRLAAPFDGLLFGRVFARRVFTAESFALMFATAVGLTVAGLTVVGLIVVGATVVGLTATAATLGLMAFGLSATAAGIFTVMPTGVGVVTGPVAGLRPLPPFFGPWSGHGSAAHVSAGQPPSGGVLPPLP
jgi:hypothetical protein